MFSSDDSGSHRLRNVSLLFCLALVGIITIVVVGELLVAPTPDAGEVAANQELENQNLKFEARADVDDNGYAMMNKYVSAWEPYASLEEIHDRFKDLGYFARVSLDEQLKDNRLKTPERVAALNSKALLLNYEGDAKRAYEVLEQVRSELSADAVANHKTLYTTLYLLGVTALRRGENDNCIMCRGESSCILPIAKSAIHTHPEGSRLAIEHFTEYLDRYPNDLEVRWLLNVAHMTLGEYPAKVNPKFLVSLDRWNKEELNIGKFRDIGHLVGVNSFNQAGGAIMDDMNNDGLLDIVTTTFDPKGSMNIYINSGKGTFDNRTKDAGVTDQLGGLNCVQTDYNNDGYLDIFIIRGAWLKYAIRPTLLRNNKDGTFTDVTEATGLLNPANSIAASWADFDNDGWLDLYVCCERQPSRLYRNRGDGTFVDVTWRAGVFTDMNNCKGIAWIDFNNDGYQDLFLNYLVRDAKPKLFENQRDGTFTDVTESMGINGPALVQVSQISNPESVNRNEVGFLAEIG
jgi:hypothetical protein